MSTEEEKINQIKKLVIAYHDWPKKGIIFQDLFPVLRDPPTFDLLIDVCIAHLKSITPPINTIIGIDSRGFLLGPIFANRLKIAFLPLRKAGKLPGKVKSQSYSLEYGKDMIEIQTDSISSSTHCVIFDDLIATGGTLGAAVKLLTDCSATVAECFVIIELKALKGRERVPAKVHSILQY